MGHNHRQDLPPSSQPVLRLLSVCAVGALLCLLLGVAFLQAQERTPDRSLAGPGWHQATADPVAPQAARTILSRQARSLFATQAAESETAITPDIAAVAAALDNDPRRIFDFVHNRIDYIPTFGSANGAQGTLLARRGNDWDQAALLVALLRAAGVSANFQTGDVVYSSERLVAWVGGANANVAFTILLNGGIPSEATTNPQGIRVTRAWVQAQVDGQTILFDPALKTYQRIDGVNVTQALSYNRAALLAAMQQGATVGADTLQNLNRAGLESHLITLSTNFVSFVENNLPEADVADVIGGRKLVESTLTALPTSLPDALAVSNVATHAEIPDAFRHRVQIQMAGIDHLLRTHEIAGKRLSLFFDGPGNAAVLRLDGQALVTGTGTALSTTQLMTITIDHPYASSGGLFADQTASFRLKSGDRYVISHSFNTASRSLLAHRNRLFGGALAQAGSSGEEVLLGEALWLIGLSWHHQTTLLQQLVDALADVITIDHHQMGVIGQETGYFVDLPLNFSSVSSRTGQSDIRAPFRVQTLMASALEHGVLEQLQGSDFPAVSTIELLGASNDQGRKTFRLNSGNNATIRPQLQNYSTAELALIDAGVAAGRQFILPEDGSVVVDQFDGVGFIDELAGSNSSSLAMIISGGLSGGFVAQPKIVNTPTLESKLDSQLRPPVLQGDKSIPLSGDPVDMANGSFVYDALDIQVGARVPLGLDFARSYQSVNSREQSVLGFGWQHNYALSVEIDSQADPVLGERLAADVAPLVAYIHAALDLLDEDRGLLDWMTSAMAARWAMDQMIDNLFTIEYGNRVLFFVRRADGSFTGPPGAGLLLRQDAGGFQLADFQDRILFFDADGRLRAWMDRNENTLQLAYDGNGRLTTVTDGVGGVLTLAYNGAGQLTTITDPGGRTVTYAYDASGDLVQATDPAGNVRRYEYDADHRLTAIFDPETPAQAALRNVYDEEGRVTQQTDARGNVTTYLFGGFRNVEIRADGSRFAYEFDGEDRWVGRTDGAGNRSAIAYNGQSLRETVTDRLGDETRFTYQSRTGQLASITNPNGDTATLTYDFQDQVFVNPLTAQTITLPFSVLTSVNYPDGSSESYTHNSRGRAVTRTDQAGQTWQLAYNARGQLTQITNPAGGAVTYTHNADGTVAGSTNSDEGITTYTYDALRRPTRITRPDASTFDITYTANDLLASFTNENGDTYTFAYDGNDNLVRITDPFSRSLQYVYDPMDQVVQATDRLGKTTGLSYDNLNRLASVTDPTGVTTGYEYDERGWRVGIVQDGKRWRTEYDAEGLTTGHTTPLGNRATIQRDLLGYASAVANALGQSTAMERDKLGRLLRLTDPLGRATEYTYDGRGLLTGATGPSLPAAAYTRDGMGLITRLTDLKGSNWDFSYTPIARVLSQTDPLQNSLQHTYDQRGRMVQTAYPDGVSVTRSYDGAGNQTRLQYSTGLDFQYTYDSLGRLIRANDIQLTRDAEGRITNTGGPNGDFGATFDDTGRLATATYNSGALTVAYVYSPTTGLLMAVSDSLTGAQVRFRYDGDLRLVGMERSNGVHATFTLDNARRLTRIQEGDLIDLRYTLDAGGQVTSLRMEAPLDPVDALAAQVETFTYDAASQVNSAGYAYDAMGRLVSGEGSTYTWDGASQLVGIGKGARAGDVTLVYNGLQQLAARTQGQSTIRYDYNYAIRLAPIVAEKNVGTNQYERFYVWTPNGDLLYMIDAANGNGVRFYHFDRTGSTLALTDEAGRVTDAYAYSPEGALLTHTGSSVQPFTYSGRWGVRQEGESGTLYHMRYRYYDATAGRFLSRDPLWPQLRRPVTLNPYQYAANDPVNGIDPLGLDIYDLERPIRVDAEDDWASWFASFVGSHYQVFIETDDVDAQGRQINYIVDANSNGMKVMPTLSTIEEHLKTGLVEYSRVSASRTEGRAVVDIFQLLKDEYKYCTVFDDCGETIDYAEKALEEVRELKTAEQYKTIENAEREQARKVEYQKLADEYAARLEEAKARMEKESLERLKSYVLELRRIDETTEVGQQRFEEIVGERETPNK